MIFANSTRFRARAIAAILAAVMFTALAVAGSAPWAAEQPTAAMASARADKMASRKHTNDVGIIGQWLAMSDAGANPTILRGAHTGKEIALFQSTSDPQKQGATRPLPTQSQIRRSVWL
jgi:hypothetical protein